VISDRLMDHPGGSETTPSNGPVGFGQAGRQGRGQEGLPECTTQPAIPRTHGQPGGLLPGSIHHLTGRRRRRRRCDRSSYKRSLFSMIR